MNARNETGEQPAGTRGLPAWWLWAVWLMGPASYGLVYFVYVVVPEWYYGCSDPGPDVCLACLLVLTHAVAGLATLVMVVDLGRFCRVPEFWILIVYWLGIAGWIGPIFALRESSIEMTLAMVCVHVSLGAAVLMPIVAGVRRLVRWPGGTK